jgi:predicted Zn-dependent protease
MPPRIQYGQLLCQLALTACEGFMKRHLLATLLLLLFVVGCATVPMTGRRQLSLVSDDAVLTSSLNQYSSYIESAPISQDQKDTELVQKVGLAISAAVEKWLSNNGYEAEIANYSWEFNLVASEEVNAFCMPGGKIVVYEGILPITQDETGLAVVMGHEVAHAVAKHSNERLSQQVAKEYTGTALVAALSLGGMSQGTTALSSLGFEAFSQYAFLLPYSRKHELEADQLGLVFMAMAGYDPNAAVDFWSRMAQLSGGAPEFISTHPADDTRISEIEAHLPEALKYYKPAR